MSIEPVSLWFGALGGQNSQHTDKLKQSRELVEMATASNVIPDPEYALITSPGFSKVRATAITDSPDIIGMYHLGGLADEFVLMGGNGLLYRDNANPPGSITSGTAFTASATNYPRFDVHENLTIIVNQSRDLPQTLNSSMTRADLGGTPPRGIDYKVFARRGCMFAPSYSGTTYRSYMSFNSVNDDHDAWTTPITTNRLNFGREGTKANVLGGELFEAHLMTFTEDMVFPVYATPNADQPLGFRDAVFKEDNGGPSIIHSVVAGDGKLFWISRNMDVKMMLRDMRVVSIGYPIQPFLRGLNDSRRTSIIGGYEPRYQLVIWAVSDGSDTENSDAILYHIPTGQFYFRTISRASFANRVVSGQARLIGGGYSGFFYNEFDSSTTGDLDNAASAIDADIITPRHHLGLPDARKHVRFFEAEFDPIGSETVTVSYRYDDNTSWSNFSSTAAISGTDVYRKRFYFGSAFRRVQLRFRDANSGERYRLLRYGFPKPAWTAPAP